jgi:cellulose synthase operon protein C
MTDFNWLNDPAWRKTAEAEPNAHSSAAPQGTTPASPDANRPRPAPGVPQPVVPHGVLGRLEAALSRASHALGARRVEVSTAFYQHTKHGHKAGSTRFVQVDKRHGAKAHIPAQVAGAAPIDTEELISQIVARPGTRTEARALPAALIVDMPIDTITSSNMLRTYVQQLFVDRTRYGAQASALAHRVYELGAQSRLGPKTEAAAAMRGALLALALRQAGIQDVARGQAVLEHIASLDFDAPHKCVSANDADREAWFVVRLLGRSTDGFGILDAMRTAAHRPFTDDVHRRTFKTLLGSADAFDALPRQISDLMSHDGAPGAVASRAKLGFRPLTASERGEHALARRAFDAAATRLERGRGALTPDQKGALFAWQQAFTEDGRDTDLSKVRERLNKFTRKTISRVGESRWKTLLPRLFRGREGSPLSALRLGTQGATRRTAQQEQALYRQALRDSLSTLEQNPEMHPVAVLTHARPRHSLVELAALHVWLERGGFAHGRMDEQAIVAVAQRAQQMCAELENVKGAPPNMLAGLRQATARWAQMTPQQLAKTMPFKSLAKRAYTIERLAVWGKVAKVPDVSPFWASLNELRSLARPIGPTLTRKPLLRAAAEELFGDAFGDLFGSFGATLETERMDDVRALLKELVDNLPSSARLRLADGGSQRFSTSGLNGMTHLGGIPISPRLTLRISRTRETVVEFIHGTHGFELFVGRAKTSQRQAGAGVLVGYDAETALTSLRVGVATNVTLHAAESTEAAGVTVRVPYRLKANGGGYDVEAARATFWEVVEHLLDEAMQSHGGGANDSFNRLAELGLDHPALSISWTDTRAKTTKRGVTVDATVNAKLFSFGPRTAVNPKTGKISKLFGVSAGPSVGMGWEKSKQHGGSTERTGRHRIEQHYVGAGRLVQLRGGIAPGFSHSLDANGRSSVGLLSLDALVATMGLDDNGSTPKLTLAIEDDKLNYRASTLEREDLSAARYADTIDSARADLIRTFAADGGSRRQGSASRSTALVDQAASAAANIDQYVATVRHNRQFNHAYKYSRRLLRDPADSIDLLTAVVRQSGNDRDVEEHNAVRRGYILGNSRAWVARKLSVRERNGATRSPGLSVGFSVNTRTSATGDHDFANLSVPFPVLEAIDDYGR